MTPRRGTKSLQRPRRSSAQVLARTRRARVPDSHSAGTDSTSIALTYAAYELAREPRFSAELRRELCRLSDAERNDLELLKELPYLNAFVKV